MPRPTASAARPSVRVWSVTFSPKSRASRSRPPRRPPLLTRLRHPPRLPSRPRRLHRHPLVLLSPRRLRLVRLRRGRPLGSSPRAAANGRCRPVASRKNRPAPQPRLLPPAPPRPPRLLSRQHRVQHRLPPRRTRSRLGSSPPRHLPWWPRPSRRRLPHQSSRPLDPRRWLRQRHPLRLRPRPLLRTPKPPPKPRLRLCAASPASRSHRPPAWAAEVRWRRVARPVAPPRLPAVASEARPRARP